jgi:hypothetical protein
MAAISALISELRVDLADEASTRFTDATLLAVFKKAIRRANRIVQRNGLQFGKKKATFNTTANTGYVVLSTVASDFDTFIAMYRTDTGEVIKQVAEWELETVTKIAGTFGYCYIDYQNDKILLEDTPASAIACALYYMPTVDPSAYTTSSSTPWSGRLDDIIMEYVGLRMKNVDEMDVSMDQKLMQDMENQILLAYAPNQATMVEGKGWL